MSNRIKFRMIAFTGAAGKSDPTAPMDGNEDNFYVDDNLSDNVPSHFEVDKVVDLAEYGLIMAVADGMGGQNAGEVASGIAVKTVQDFFAPAVLTPQIVKTPETRRKYLEQLVIEADKRIKDDARINSAHEGMGSTIILAWVVGNQLTLTWCGDSRAYRFNPNLKEIERLSTDHSYVQELVNQGVISYDDTFEHPQGNIVTRSLGERGTKAQPETRQFEVYKDDIILLCSDGLSGVLRDKKTLDHNGNYYPGENIEDIIKNNCSTLKQCKDALWNAAERADWYDNVTIILCQILDGVKSIDVKETQKQEEQVSKEVSSQPDFMSRTIVNIHVTPKSLVILCLFLIAIVIGGILGNQYVSRLLNVNKDITPVDSDSSSRKVEIVQNINSRKDWTNSKDELLNTLQKECSEFILLADLDNIENEYFDDIKEKIQAIEDSTSLKEATDEVNRFIHHSKEKVDQIKIINDKLIIYKGNHQIKNKLNGLKRRCIKENISNLESELARIVPSAELESDKGRTKSNSKGSGEDGIEDDEEGPTEDEITPIPGNLTMTCDSDGKLIYWCRFIMPDWKDWPKKSVSIIQYFEKLNYKYDGIYTLGCSKIQYENTKKGSSYQLKFIQIAQ